ncbi:MAG: Trm112 family protein [Candidatus Zixiibacteriota bacterium]
MLDEELLKILVCPACKGDLVYDREKSTLDCHHCRLRYEVRDDVPIMLIEEAQRF